MFATKNGHPISVSNDERLLRSFVDDNRDAPEEKSISTPRASTAARPPQWSSVAAGLTLASRLLVHANEQITRTSDVVGAEEADPITVDVLDELLGS